MHLRTAAVAAFATVAVVVVSAAASPVLLESLAGRQVYPATNWWNQDVSAAPVDPNSAQYVSWIGATRQLHPDFGPPPYGIPYVVVAGDQARVPVTFDYADESDTGIPGLAGYPVPEEAKTQPHFIEGDVPGGGTSGDRHLLIIDRDRWVLYELFATTWNAAAGRWEAGSGRDLRSEYQRSPPGHVDVGRRRGPGHSSGTRALRRRVRRRRDRACVPFLDACDQRLCAGRRRTAPDRPPARRRWVRACG